MGLEILYFVAGFGAALVLLGLLRRKRDPFEGEQQLSEDLQVAFHLARHLSNVDQQGLVDRATLAAALVADEQIVATLTRCGWDAEALHEALLRHTSPKPGAKARWLREWSLEQPVEEVLMAATTRARQANRAELGCHELLAELLLRRETDQHDPLRVVLRDSGIEWSTLFFALVHRRPDAVVVSPDETGAHEVVLYNDDFTKTEVVVDVLRHVFELSEAKAQKLMYRLHLSGSGGRANCGNWPANEAATRANRGRDRARAAGSPLRVAVVPPTSTTAHTSDAGSSLGS